MGGAAQASRIRNLVLVLLIDASHAIELCAPYPPPPPPQRPQELLVYKCTIQYGLTPFCSHDLCEPRM
jgi:hypothetical protein